ncbi:MAG: TonB-dependent receptor [Prevotella sp.]|nr:TonB-dependent receptor [Prevotella sp.]
MEKRLMTLLAVLFLFVGGVLAQTKVSGTVVSQDDGQPVIGATVKVVGTNNATATDVNGHFSLSAKTGATLEVSSVGMITQKVQASGNMTVVLENDDKMLDEVMVVAYGTQKKSSFTGSAAVVKSEDLAKHITTNVTEALVGSVPGLQLRNSSGQPGSAGEMNIRGITSLYADIQPLVIVDGSPYPGNLSSIPTNDIESVTVLKDAASAALYGARGAAGVIIITTKRGTRRDAEVTVDMKWGVNSRAVQDYDRITDPGQYYEAYYSQLYNYGFYGQGMSQADANAYANKKMLSDLVYNVYTLPEGEQLIGTDGKLNPNATLGRKFTNNGTDYYLMPDDWQDLIYRNSLRQEYNVSVNGGNDRSSFYASVGYLNDEGIMINSDYERISARIRADYQAKKWLKLGANAQYVHSDQTSVSNTGTQANSGNIMFFAAAIAPIYPAYVRLAGGGKNGDPIINKDQYGNPAYDYGTATSGYGLRRPFMGNGNPFGDINLNDVNTIGDNFNGTLTLDLQLTDWLKFNATSTVLYSQSQYAFYQNPFYGLAVATKGELRKSNTNTMRTNNVQTLTFAKDFGKHGVTALIGHEYYRVTTRYLAAEGTGGFSPEIPELNAFATPKKNYSYKTGYNVEGYFFNGQYNYNDKYFASASYRRDASSRFAKENRWGDFWSVGGAWLINKEEWFTASWIDELKVKASIGQQGNDNIGNWAYTDLYSLSANGAGMSASFAQKGNSEITWETTTNFNIGTEFSLFKGRLAGSLDFYNKKTTDLLFWISIPESSGSRGYYGNIGDIRNCGVELTLTGALVRTKDIDWTVTANISHNSTKILKLPESKTAELGGFSDSDKNNMISSWFKENGPLYNTFLADYAGVNEKGEALYWVDEDLYGTSAATSKPGQKRSFTTTNPNEATRYEHGSNLPDVFGGFNTSFRYKNFDLSATFDYQIGGQIYDMVYANMMTPAESSGNAGSAIHKDYIKAWSPNNTSSDIPRWQYGQNAGYSTFKSSRFLTNASYFNFQSFTVGYTLPKNLIDGISKIRVYCAGENLGFISARKGLDPRYSFDGNTSSTVTYSPARNISGGVQVTF